MKSETNSTILWWLVGLSLLLRLLLISKGPYHIDVLSLSAAAEQTVATGKLHYFFYWRTPLMVILGAFGILIGKLFSFHDTPFILNLISALFGALGVGSFYLMVKQALDKRTAFISSLLLSTSPIYLGVSTFGKDHSLTIFLLCLGIYFVLQFLSSSSRNKLIASSIIFGLMGAARLQDLILCILPISFLFMSQSSCNITQRIKNLFLCWSIILITCLPFYIPYLLTPKPTSSVTLTIIKDILINQQSIGIGTNITLILISILKASTFLSMIMTILGLLVLFQHHKKFATLTTLIMVIYLVFFSLLTITIPRLYVVMFLPMIIAQGYLLNRLLNLKPLFKMIGIGCLSFILFIPLYHVFPFLYFRHYTALMIDYPQWVATKTEPNALLIVGDDSQIFTRYAKRHILSKPLKNNYLTNEELLQFKNELEKQLNQGTPVYATAIGLYAYDPNKQFSQFVHQNYKVEWVDAHLYEDWHEDVLKLRLYLNGLYRISLR